jgi:hypothetical protein
MADIEHALKGIDFPKNKNELLGMLRNIMLATT